MARQAPQDITVCRNRKAGFRFEILEKLECGIALVGSEVKSLRERNASIEEAYARIDDDGVWLVGTHIAAYPFARTRNHEPTRPRKLLLHSREIRRWRPRVEQRGQTLVPLSIYFNDRGIAKVSLALVRGKTAGDKRETIKKREHQREVERAMRRGSR